jgi:hypothetical protein
MGFFADISKLNAENVIFQKPGNYIVTFTVSEADNPSDTDSAFLKVTVIPDSKPAASIISPDSSEFNR